MLARDLPTSERAHKGTRASDKTTPRVTPMDLKLGQQDLNANKTIIIMILMSLIVLKTFRFVVSNTKLLAVRVILL